MANYDKIAAAHLCAPRISDDKGDPMNQQDRNRKRALIVFQIVVYGYLLSMFLIQLHMSLTRDW